MSTLDYSAIKLMINEALKKYDADKTGKVDYALESSGGSVWSTRCTEAYEKSRLESLFGIPLWYSSYSPRQVIQHRSSLGSGECWAFRGTGYLVIKLAYPVFVTEVSYEHLPSCVHPEHDIKSSPRNFEIWSLKDVDDLSSRFLIGEYEYDNKGEALQTFKAQNIPNYKSPFIELIVHSNWGADYTCLYRLRVHGHRTVNTTMLVISVELFYVYWSIFNF
uniref:SUN domain-containing protein n=1 Tax=Syphacia muris TaxID=451379 RepID=A0A0N5AJ83_9BILA